MNYFREMFFSDEVAPMRLSAIALAAALAVSACGASTPTTAGEQVETTTTTPANEAPQTSGGVAEVGSEPVSLGDQEAGFGPGSLAALAGEYAGRIQNVEGDWFPAPQSDVDVPDVCGIPEPVARQAFGLARPVDASGVRADVITVEVRVYESEQVAESLVELLNGESAEACDLASADLGVEDTAPGVTFDFGDGVGEPAAVADTLAEGLPAAARSYDFEIVFGTFAEPLVQQTTVVADGRFAIAVAVISTSEEVDALEAEVLAALFDEPGPEVIDVVDLDEVIDDVRRSVLSDEDLPEFYEPTSKFQVGLLPDPDECFVADGPVSATLGPTWLAISPGVGASDFTQRARIYANSDLAMAAFEEVAERGAECFPVELALPEGFDLLTSSLEVIEVDGRRVAFGEIDLTQTLGNQSVGVEAKIASTQVDETLLNVLFFGLAGDSPDLVELVVEAASRAEQ